MITVLYIIIFLALLPYALATVFLILELAADALDWLLEVLIAAIPRLLITILFAIVAMAAALTLGSAMAIAHHLETEWSLLGFVGAIALLPIGAFMAMVAAKLANWAIERERRSSPTLAPNQELDSDGALAQ